MFIVTGKEIDLVTEKGGVGGGGTFPFQKNQKRSVSWGEKILVGMKVPHHHCMNHADIYYLAHVKILLEGHISLSSTHQNASQTF